MFKKMVYLKYYEKLESSLVEFIERYEMCITIPNTASSWHWDHGKKQQLQNTLSSLYPSKYVHYLLT